MHNQHRIVTATPADYETIRSIAHATWPPTFREIMTGAQLDYMLHMMYRREALEQQAAEGHVFLLFLEAQRGNQNANPNPRYLRAQPTKFKAVGYASYQLDAAPGIAKLHKIYLLPQCQGKGYGRLLINKITSIARNADRSALRLGVNYRNKAIGMYEHLGFVKYERRDLDIGNGYLMEDWLMEMPLHEPAD